jgi:hypothetical protein
MKTELDLIEIIQEDLNIFKETHQAGLQICEHPKCQDKLSEIGDRISRYQAISSSLSRSAIFPMTQDDNTAIFYTRIEIDNLPPIENYEPDCPTTEFTTILTNSLNGTKELLLRCAGDLLEQEITYNKEIPLVLPNIPKGFWGYDVRDPNKGEYFTLL